MLPNGTQVQTSLATLLGIAAGYAAGHGWLGLDASTWGQILAAGATVGIAAWPLLATRLKSLKNTVGNSGAIVVTDRATAQSLPNNPNVISASPELAAQISLEKRSQ